MGGDDEALRHFEHSADFDPEMGVEALCERVPAKWCVYLLADERDRPIQLLCVKNLRASLRRRLGEPDEAGGPTRRADLSAVVRRVHWSRVDSTFEQDFLYLEAARDWFPESYGGVLGFYPAWFVHVNPATQYPRFTRQNQIDKTTGHYFGPLPDKQSADKFLRNVEDAFDLCRDWDRLTSDGNDPCQWRQMGKCVGPCEGLPNGVSLDAYRGLVAHAAGVLADLDGAIERETLRMRHAAAAQAYEVAAGIKGFIESLAALREGHFRHVRLLEEFRFLAVMPGGNEAAVKLFLVTPGGVRFIAAMLEPPTKQSSEPVLRAALALAQEQADRPLATAEFERISLVTSHLFPNRRQPGEFIPMGELDEKRFLVACRNLAKRKTEAERDEEGEVRGLQAL